MNNWNISKSFSFCFGHRVWRQRLNSELSCNSSCKCRHQHGHEGTVIISLKSSVLDDKGMVIDFVELSWFKKWLDEVLDHKMILDINDPALPIFYPLLNGLQKSDFSAFNGLIRFPEKYHIINPEMYKDYSEYEQEIYEGLVLVDFIPTSENLSKWLFDIVQKKLEGYATVSSVEFQETPKSKSVYSR